MKTKKEVITLFLLVFLSILNLKAQDEINPTNDIIPNRVSFFDSKFAYAGDIEPKILIVDNLSADDIGDESTGRGSFTWCITRPYPRIIIFEVSGYIDYSQRDFMFRVEQPYMWIAGQTAPEPGICIKGANMTLNHTHDILIQHLKFRAGDATTGRDPVGRDAFTIYDCKNVCIDYCTMSWSVDEIFDSTGDSDNVTLSNCLLYEGLHQSYHYNEYSPYNPEQHSCGMKLGDTDHMVVWRSISAQMWDRVCWMAGPGYNFCANNLFYNPTYCAGVKFGISGNLIYGSYVGNVIDYPTSWDHRLSKYSGEIRSGTDPESKIYLKDNLSRRKIENPSLSEWECINNNSNVPGPVPESPFDISAFNLMESKNVEEYVLQYAGTMFRDVSDERVITDIRDRTSSGIIHSQDSLPARVLSWNENSGNMLNGHDWSVESDTLFIDGGEYILSTNCPTISDVVSYLNTILPSNIEAYLIWAGGKGNESYVGLRTKKKGSDQLISIDKECEVFNYHQGMYYGSNGVGGFPVLVENTVTHSIPQNPNNDDDKNGFTDIQEWIYNISDTIKPTAPILTLFNNSKSKNANLKWNKINDNLFFDKYNVYRNDKLIAAVKDTVYVDSTVLAGESYTYEITATDKAGNESSPSNELKFGTSTNTNKETKDKIIVYPNPANDFIQISFPNNINRTISVRIYSSNGSVVLSQKKINPNSIIKIDISSLDSGVYIGEIIDKFNYQTFRFIKNQ